MVNIPKRDMKITLGDANDNVKKEILIPTIKNYSKSKKSNKNGQFLLDFTKERNII